MSKSILFYIVDNGVDGKAPTEIRHAFFDEEERDQFFTEIDPKVSAYLAKTEEVVDVELRRKQIMKNLNGLQSLLLGFPQEHPS